ncbi:MAG TPA: LamG domain-containing protein, partial [Acidimicrobiales bacterium]|nr:LamG domain-containing protein [Acidimicrobiales bacterium]
MGQVEASGTRRPAARVGAAGALVVAAALVVGKPWHGPIIVALSSGHGVTASDLVPLALVGLAAWLWRRSTRASPLAGSADSAEGAGTRAGILAGRWVGPVSAALLGVLLLVVSVVDLTDRGPLVPAGGGTFDHTVQLVTARRASPVDAWSYVALTDDGATLRLYVDGAEVASQARSGARDPTGEPLWIGGNEPYDECFDGLIDDVRVYARALAGDEIRADMAAPVAPDPPGPAGGPRRVREGATRAHLVGAYGFDEGAGGAVADVSGEGNGGTVVGATWASHGRHGTALRFDGAGDRVRIGPSPSLDRDGGLTLSAWIRPTAAQSGWRTIVHRQRDSYFLVAGTRRTGVSGRADDVLAATVVAGLAWLALVTARTRGRWLGDRRRSWRVAVVLVLGGVLVDVVLVPSATAFGPALLAAWFAATATDRREAVGGWLVAGAALGMTTASLADAAGLGAWVQR